MNVILHIDRIVLDGLNLAPGQTQLLQQAVTTHLTEMLTQGLGSSSLDDPKNRDSSIRLGRSVDAMSLGPQLANAIYSKIPQSQLGLPAGHGGRS